MYQALTDGKASKAILRCHGFDEVVSSEKQYLQYMTLDRVAEILEKLEKKDFLEHTKEELEKGLLTLNVLWQRSLNNIRDAKALLSCVSEIKDVIDIAQCLEKLDKEVSLSINQENTAYEPITITHEIIPETQEKDEGIRQEVAAILKEQGYSDQAIPAPFQALDLPYINDVRLINDLASSSAQFGIMHYELQKQGYLKAAQLAEDIGYGLFTAGRILVEETADLVKGMESLVLGTGKFALDTLIDPKQAYFTTTDALNRCYQSIEYSLVKLADFTNMIIHMPEEEVVKFFDEKLTLNTAYDYISNLSPEDTFRLGVQFTINPWIRTKLLKTLPLCYKAVDGLVSQANKLQRAQKNKQTLALASKFLKERKLLRLYKKAFKSAKSGLGKPFSKATQRTISELLEIKKSQLILRYSKKAIDEACKVLSFQHPEVVGKTKKPFKLLAEVTRDISKIDSNPRWHKLRFDPSRGNACKLVNVREASAGIACEEQGLLRELIREPIGKSEFIDKTGKFWDVKAPTSYASNGKKIFNTNDGIMQFTASLKETILKDINEHLIIDLTHLNKVDHSVLYDILKKLPINDLKRMIIVDTTNPINSKTTQKLLKFLNK